MYHKAQYHHSIMKKSHKNFKETIQPNTGRNPQGKSNFIFFPRRKWDPEKEDLLIKPHRSQFVHVHYDPMFFRLMEIHPIQKSYSFTKNHHKRKKRCRLATGPLKLEYYTYMFHHGVPVFLRPHPLYTFFFKMKGGQGSKNIQKNPFFSIQGSRVRWKENPLFSILKKSTIVCF